MPRTISADGRTITVPDDATPDEINRIFGPAPKVPATPPIQRASTFGGGMIEGAKDLGQGIMNLPQAILHPADTFNAMGAQQRALADRASADAKAGHYGNAVWHGIDAMLPGIGPLDAQLTDEYQSGAPGAKAAAMGRTLVNAAPSLVAAGARPVAAAVARRVGSGLNNIAIGTTAADRVYGANPGAALYDQGIAGFSGPSLAGQVDEAIPQVAAEHTADLAQHGSGKTVSLGNAVNEPFDGSIGAKTDPRTGIVNPVQVAKMRKVQRLINSVPDPDTGQATMAPRPLNDLSPLEANTFKSNLYGLANYDAPTANQLANNAVKGAARNVKVAIQQAVPESVQSGQDLHSLMAAKDVLQPASRSYRLPTSRDGIIRHAIQGGATTGAQVLKAGAQALPIASVPLTVLPRTEVDGSDHPEEPQGQVEAQPEQGQKQVTGNAGEANTGSDLESQEHPPQTTTSYAPATHTFSTSEWIKGNPGADPDEAREHAQALGYEVTD